MAIGVFDSGIGGLSIHRALVDRLPDADFVYLGDQANAPYGGRPGEEIVALTRAGCETLFGQGCDLVVLACNTASAIALRRLQQDWLPGFRRSRGRALNVLGIIVPTIEAALGLSWSDAAEARAANAVSPEILGVFATPATVASGVYETEIGKRRSGVAVFSEPCPDLACMIESGAPADALRDAIETHFRALESRISRPPDRAVLGCTHYEIVADLFRTALPLGTPLIHQPSATADALARYLARHPEYDAGSSGARRFLTTGRPGMRDGLVETFWGAPVRFEGLDAHAIGPGASG
jgi:glutamate racemase